MKTLQDILSVRKVSIGLLAFGIALSVSCTSEPKNETSSNNALLDASIGEPVQRDFAEIKRSGVLRMITSYSSGAYFYTGEYKLVLNMN